MSACVIEGCESPQGRARGWCVRHYSIWHRLGDPEAPTRPYAPQVGDCMVSDCAARPKARGLCLRHYKLFRRHGTPTPRLRGAVVDGKRICSRCKRDLPVAELRTSWCNDCWGEDNRRRQHERRMLSAAPSGVSERFTRQDVLIRDGYMCGLCIEPIDPDLPYPHPRSASLDHIIPLARGGSHSMSNAQAAHLDCNRRKWAHVPIESGVS